MVGRFPLKLQENTETTKASALKSRRRMRLVILKKESKILKLSELLNDKEDKGAS